MTDMISIPWISIVLFLPLVGSGILMLVPAENERAHRHIALAFMLGTFLLSLVLPVIFDRTVVGYQLTTAIEDLAWIPAIGARYSVGIDGISLWLVMLTTFLGPIVVLASYKYITTHVREFHVAVLLLQTAMIGAFVSLDLLLFYVFWELMLIPMYLLIGVWGSTDRIYAAVKLFVYTMVGSLLMLVAIIYVYSAADVGSFNIDLMIEGARSLGETEQRLLFIAFALAFMIKVPVFPLHTWLPDAHVQAPTAGSVILAGVLLKMGTYGLVRYGMPMFPNAMYWAAPVIGALSVIGIIYGALVAYVQKDIKKLVAYSSVSHLGFVVLGLAAMTPTAVTGAMFQGLAHGIATSGLFLCIGILYERRHTREMSEFGGLTKVMPVFAVFFIIIALASAGLPGLVGFVGEYLILIGSFDASSFAVGGLSVMNGRIGVGPEQMAVIFVTIATIGVILGALYLLHLVQQTMFGPLDEEKNGAVKDLSGREIAYLLPIVLMSFFMGLQPQLFLRDIEPAVERTLVGVYQDLSGDQRAQAQGWSGAQSRARGQWSEMGDSTGPWSIQESHKDSHGEGHDSDEHNDEHVNDEHGANHEEH